MAEFKEILKIGLDGEYGGPDWEYNTDTLKRLNIDNLKYIQEALIYFLYETEKLIREKKLEAVCPNTTSWN